jgi:HPt (histidine-containing phosphotransfer) domain-containing protein
MAAVSLITFDYLKEISGGDTDFQKEIVQTFLEEMANEISLLQAATASQSWSQVGSLAHKIKAPINMLCTEPLKLRILFIEKSAKKGEELHVLTEEVRLLIADLEAAMTELKSF